jgi:hypothetical protein
MIKAACHCGAVRLEADPAPTRVNDCNCSICRRYGVLWAYYDRGQVRLVPGFETTEVYLWGDRDIGFHRCAACGCVTHWAPAREPSLIRGVNVRMMPALDPAQVVVERSNNGGGPHLFWTRPDEPVEGDCPPDPPGATDWR